MTASQSYDIVRLMTNWLRWGWHLWLVGMLAAGGMLSAAGQENWPQFRGPGARGVSDSQKLPLVWSAQTNVAWRTAIPGRGWSSPVVSGQRVFLTTAVSEG